MAAHWMRMPGETWPGVAASFLGMWVMMMGVMMLPSLVPMLLRYRSAIGTRGATRVALLTALVGAGYFLVWTALGVVAFPLGFALTAVEMRLSPPAPVFPIAASAVVLLAGAFQFTTWKAHHLARCRESPGHGRILPANADTAWRHGLRLGLHCIYSCSGLTAIILVFGMMNLRVMAVVAAAITAERLLPAGAHAAKSIGAVAVLAGFLLLAQAAGV